jgi:glutamyl-Q tRNA(Asp) synthetase
MQASYIGRFAPSPSGPLHFGSLICALASYLHARQHQGKWLVRIEDIDTPRVEADMSKTILQCLQAHGLRWDDEVVYQSQRFSAYEQSIQQLKAQNQVYACVCSRKEYNARAPYYDRHCRDAGHDFHQRAIRWKNDRGQTRFLDLHFGELSVNERFAKEDPVLKRADGIFAYHLAVVTDDIAQNITHVVRGADLIDTTPLHINLFAALGACAPQYFHVPVASDAPGQKLSKQRYAQAINNQNALDNLKSALVFLGMNMAEIKHLQSIDSLLQWAVEHWQQSTLTKETEILVSVINDVYCMNL